MQLDIEELAKYMKSSATSVQELVWPWNSLNQILKV